MSKCSQAVVQFVLPKLSDIPSVVRKTISSHSTIVIEHMMLDSSGKHPSTGPSARRKYFD
jgi:hypothetical protein